MVRTVWQLVRALLIVGFSSDTLHADLIFNLHVPGSAGAAAGAALRAAQVLFLQQTVPFTYRKHTLILPVGIELVMGDATFKQQIGGYAQAGKLLKENNSDYQLIAGIAKRVINAVGQEYGGGYQSHVKKFKWEVVVVDDKVPNAFVLPGGKIVVFTGAACICLALH